MYKIMLIEDDENIREYIKKYLESLGYEVKYVKDFTKSLDIFKQFKPHLVLLDLLLPIEDGHGICMKIRKISKIPIIYISSKTQPVDMITAMNLGADDYIAKPFDFSLLSAKIKALLRRSYEFDSEENIIEYNLLKLDLKKMTATKNGTVKLTESQARILYFLLKKGGKIVKRDQLMDFLWETCEFVDDNTLSVLIMRLRKELAKINADHMIKTKVKVGYYVE